MVDLRKVRVPGSGPAKTIEERRVILQSAVDSFTVQGYRVESQSETQAILIGGRRVNHVLHLILTVLTLVWGAVWIYLSVAKGEKRMTVQVNEYGEIFQWEGIRA